MRVPISWLREFVELPESETARAVADRLIRAGLEVEGVDEVGADVSRAARGRPRAGVRRRRALQRQDHPLVLGRRRRGRAARHHLRRPQLRRRRPRRGRAPRRCAAGRLRDHRAEDLRPRVRRHDLLAARARPRRRPHRHHRVARRRSRAGRGGRADPVAARGRARHRGHARPRLHDVDPRRRPRGGDRVRRPAEGPGRRRDQRADRRRLPGPFGGPRRLPGLRGGRRHRLRPDGAEPALAAAQAPARRHPADLARRRRDQLRDVRARPADPRLGPGQAARRDRRTPFAAGGEAAHARRRDARARRPRTSSSPTTPARSGSAA